MCRPTFAELAVKLEQYLALCSASPFIQAVHCAYQPVVDLQHPADASQQTPNVATVLDAAAKQSSLPESQPTCNAAATSSMPVAGSQTGIAASDSQGCVDSQLDALSWLSQDDKSGNGSDACLYYPCDQHEYELCRALQLPGCQADTCCSDSLCYSSGGSFNSSSVATAATQTDLAQSSWLLTFRDSSVEAGYQRWYANKVFKVGCSSTTMNLQETACGSNNSSLC